MTMKYLFLLMSVLPQALFSLVGCHFMSFSLFTAGHIKFSLEGYFTLTFDFTFVTKDFAGLKEGI